MMFNQPPCHVHPGSLPSAPEPRPRDASLDAILGTEENQRRYFAKLDAVRRAALRSAATMEVARLDLMSVAREMDGLADFMSSHLS